VVRSQDGKLLGQPFFWANLTDIYDTSCRFMIKPQTAYGALDALRAGLELVMAHRAGEACLFGQ
jgi:hypothetical protein